MWFESYHENKATGGIALIAEVGKKMAGKKKITDKVKTGIQKEMRETTNKQREVKAKTNIRE